MLKKRGYAARPKVRRHVGFCHQHITIGQGQQSARVAEPGGKTADDKTLGGNGRLAGCPADGFHQPEFGDRLGCGVGQFGVGALKLLDRQRCSVAMEFIDQGAHTNGGNHAHNDKRITQSLFHPRWIVACRRCGKRAPHPGLDARVKRRRP